jgi:hypothetical protein
MQQCAVCVRALRAALLAVRYAMSMAHLDPIEVQGLAFSIAGLTAVPAVMLTAARFPAISSAAAARRDPLLAGAVPAVAVWIDFWRRRTSGRRFRLR